MWMKNIWIYYIPSRLRACLRVWFAVCFLSLFFCLLLSLVDFCFRMENCLRGRSDTLCLPFLSRFFLVHICFFSLRTMRIGLFSHTGWFWYLSLCVWLCRKNKLRVLCCCYFYYYCACVPYILLMCCNCVPYATKSHANKQWLKIIII